MTTTVPATSRRTGRWRTPVVTVCLILLGLVAPLSIVALWTQDEVANTDRYVAMVAPLAHDPGFQDAVAERITQQIVARLGVDTSRPIGRAARKQIEAQVSRVVASEAFASVWEQANRAAHGQVVALLTGSSDVAHVEGDAVTLDLATLVDMVKQRLVDAGFALAASIPSVPIELTVASSAHLATAQRVFRALATLAHVLPVAGLALLVVALAVARRRRRTVVAAGLVVAASMLLLAAALQIVRGVYLDAISTQQISRATAAAFYDTVVAFIRHNLRVVLVVSLIVSVAAWLLGLTPAARRRVSPVR